MALITGILFVLLLSSLYSVTGHPAPDEKFQRDHLTHERSKRALSSCMSSRTVRSAESARQSWFVSRVKRDKNTILGKDHHSASKLNISDNPFTGKASCLLNPEGELGPYWVKGELIRSDVRDGQVGIPLYLDILVIDVNTCRPVPGVYLDIWGCNSTGVYSGVQAHGNGNYADVSNLNKTFGRGLQPTGPDGIAKFITTFPGHYMGRTTHIHVKANLNGTVLPNGTYTSGTVPHIGQILFDQSLIHAIESTSPYNTNTIPITPNANDMVVDQETGTGSDPIMNFAMLGGDLTDGLLGWITLGIDLSTDYAPRTGFGAMLTDKGGAIAEAKYQWVPGPGEMGGLGPSTGGHGPCGPGGRILRPGGPLPGPMGMPPLGVPPGGMGPGTFLPGFVPADCEYEDDD